MYRPTLAVALILLASASACGTDDEGDGSSAAALDCAWLADENNCWRTTARAAEGCVFDAPGTFAADRLSCTAEDGALVSFTQPVPVDLAGSDHPWDFDVERDGASCLSFSSSADESRAELTTDAGTVVVEGSSRSIEITCPDGSSYRGSSLTLLECENFFEDMPGWGHVQFEGGDTAFALSGLGGDAGLFGSSLQIWDCASPAAEEISR